MLVCKDFHWWVVWMRPFLKLPINAFSEYCENFCKIMLTALQGTCDHLGDDVVHVEVQHVVEEVDKLVLLELAQHLLAEQHGLLHQSEVSSVIT